jgi:hypothetical protein
LGTFKLILKDTTHIIAEEWEISNVHGNMRKGILQSSSFKTKKSIYLILSSEAFPFLFLLLYVAVFERPTAITK